VREERRFMIERIGALIKFMGRKVRLATTKGGKRMKGRRSSA
jgi:hypothetical protein